MSYSDARIMAYETALGLKRQDDAMKAAIVGLGIAGAGVASIFVLDAMKKGTIATPDILKPIVDAFPGIPSLPGTSGGGGGGGGIQIGGGSIVDPSDQPANALYTIVAKVSPTSGSDVTTFTFTVSVTNKSTGKPVANVPIYLVVTSSLGTSLVPLAINGSVPKTNANGVVSLPVSLGVGQRTVYFTTEATADPSQTLNRSNDLEMSVVLDPQTSIDHVEISGSPATTRVGQYITLNARVIADGGAAFANKAVGFWQDGKYIGSRYTNSGGYASLQVKATNWPMMSFDARSVDTYLERTMKSDPITIFVSPLPF